MAGRGPAPKSPAQRRRRNVEPPADQLSPGARYRGKYPALPKTYRTRTWDQANSRHIVRTEKFYASTRRWYEAWATSPMALEFTQVHFLRLQDLAVLKDRFDRGDVAVAGELRQGLAGFGGSPYDVRRLGKRFVNSPTGDAGGAPPKGATVHRLRAVDPDAVAGA